MMKLAAIKEKAQALFSEARIIGYRRQILSGVASDGEGDAH